MSTRPPGGQRARFDWTTPLRNAGRLAAGRGVQAVCSLVYLAIAARTLGPNDFGALVLIHSLALAISQFSGFGSKEMLVRFGSLAIADATQPGRLSRFVWYGLLLDLISTVLAWVLMAVAAGWALSRFGLADNLHRLTLTYWFAAVAIMNLSQTVTGVLRLFSRFRLLAYQSTIEPLLRLAGSVLVLVLDGGFLHFVVAWFVALVAGRIALVLCAWQTLHKKHAKAFGRPPPLRELVNPEPGIWRFVLWLQWTTTVSLADSQLPLLAVGSLADPGAAGLFKVAQQITSVLERASSKLLVPSLFTELARLSATGERAKRRYLVYKITVWTVSVGSGVFLLLAAIGRPLLSAVAGPEFVGAYAVVLWLAAAGVIGTLGVTFEPLLMAAGHVRFIALAGTAPLVVYLPMLFGLLGPLGLTGVGMAIFTYALMTTGILYAAARRTLREPRLNAEG